MLLLTGCCALALVSVSAALNLIATQRPRFYGIKAGRDVGIQCVFNSPLPTAVRWYKADAYNQDRVELKRGGIQVQDQNQTRNSFLFIRRVKVEDSGVYFCEANKTWGPGTQVVAIRDVNIPDAQYRSTMKDALILLQALLLAACVAAVLMRRRTLSQRKDSIYEEPETDHIYEGLAIESCGGGLYEELSVYAQADCTEAPWE